MKRRTREGEDAATPRPDLERLFNIVPDMLEVASVDGYFKAVNPAWEEPLGYTVHELLTTPYERLIHPDDLVPTRQEVDRQVRGGPTVRFTNRWRHKDGSYRTLEWTATPAIDNLIYAVARDITGRARAEAALQERGPADAGPHRTPGNRASSV